MATSDLFEPFELNAKYWLLEDGKSQPILVDGIEIIAAMALGLPASYWPEGETL